MRQWDTVTAGQIEQAFNHWDDIELDFKGEVIRSGGHGFVGIGRRSCSTSCRRAARSWASSWCSRPMSIRTPNTLAPTSSSPATASTPRSARCTDVFQPELVVRPQPLHLARHQPPVRRLHLRVREDRARLVSGPHLQVRRKHHHLHRRVPRARVAGARARQGDAGRIHRLLREKLFAGTLRGYSLMTNARHLRGSAWLNFPAREVRAVVAPRTRTAPTWC